MITRYKLLALGGPNDGQWLPWDGSVYGLNVPVLQEVNPWQKANPSADFEIAHYEVDQLKNPKTNELRHVYRFSTLTHTAAEHLLVEHLLENFVRVGDIEE